MPTFTWFGNKAARQQPPIGIGIGIAIGFISELKTEGDSDCDRDTDTEADLIHRGQSSIRLLMD